ncbi:hypothetical protein D3C87_2027850 [compost metagenome]
MQAVAAIKQWRTDAPDAVVDFTQADGIASLANVREAALVVAEPLGGDTVRGQGGQALRLIHVGQQHPGRSPYQQGLGQAFLIAAA